VYQGLEPLLKSPRQNFRQLASVRAGFTAAANMTFDSLKRRYEQYVLRARQSAQAGDKIEAENLLQHAEHYYRTAALQNAGHQL